LEKGEKGKGGGGGQKKTAMSGARLGSLGPQMALGICYENMRQREGGEKVESVCTVFG
jgi:hypothetical protein